MKILCLAVLGIATVMSPTTLLAQAATYQATGTAAIAGASINPPDPVDGCNRAKQDATKKAATAGYSGHVEWDHLSVDSDCKLKTSGAASTGFFFIFTASGKFYKQ